MMLFLLPNWFAEFFCPLELEHKYKFLKVQQRWALKRQRIELYKNIVKVLKSADTLDFKIQSHIALTERLKLQNTIENSKSWALVSFFLFMLFHSLLCSKRVFILRDTLQDSAI